MLTSTVLAPTGNSGAVWRIFDPDDRDDGDDDDDDDG